MLFPSIGSCMEEIAEWYASRDWPQQVILLRKLTTSITGPERGFRPCC